MASSRTTNPFVRQIYFWWLIAPMLSCLLFPVFIPAASLKIANAETQFVYHCGRDAYDVTTDATLIFNELFVHTGILKATMSSSEDAEESRSDGFSWMGRLLHGWLARFWLFTYRVVWRWTAFWPLYVIGVLGISFPCLVDGLVTRAKKRYRFGQYNPFAFNVGGTLFAIAVGWMIYVPLLPVPLTAPIMGGFFSLLGLFAWFTAANFQRVS